MGLGCVKTLPEVSKRSDLGPVAIIRDRAVSLETQPMTAVALRRTSADRRPGSSSKKKYPSAWPIASLTMKHASLCSSIVQGGGGGKRRAADFELCQ